MLHTGKNETVTFTAGGTGLTSTSPHRNIIFIIVGSGISALGLSTRYIEITKKAYVGMTDKGIFYNTDIADEKLTPQKSRSPKTIPLRASSGIPLSMACFALPPFAVCRPKHLHRYFICGDMTDVFGQTRCHVSSKTRCNCACRLTGRETLFGGQPQACYWQKVLVETRRLRWGQARNTHFLKPESQPQHEATTTGINMLSTYPQAWPHRSQPNTVSMRKMYV